MTLYLTVLIAIKKKIQIQKMNNLINKFMLIKPQYRIQDSKIQ